MIAPQRGGGKVSSAAPAIFAKIVEKRPISRSQQR
jgi:hypothetical protein